MKSELHLNQDGVKTGEGTATLPVKDFFKQIIAEAKPRVVLTIGTAGSVYDDFTLGDVVITRAAKFRLQNEFRNEPFNNKIYKSRWTIPTGRLIDAARMAQAIAPQLAEPPFAPPTKRFRFRGSPITAPSDKPDFKLDGREMPAFHPILTTDYFEYGTTTNRLDREGAAVEMGDAALGLACSELAHPPNWTVIRNMSDPVINGALPAKQFHLNEQTTWAVGYLHRLRSLLEHHRGARNVGRHRGSLGSWDIVSQGGDGPIVRANRIGGGEPWHERTEPKCVSTE
jgi:nucleoside phosphorylase